ncbi:MAG: hypothetical protein KDA92_11570 [Planctomycetales bacterium]|nr:hypothetical protein [Planctomycetales bacterium]
MSHWSCLIGKWILVAIPPAVPATPTSSEPAPDSQRPVSVTTTELSADADIDLNETTADDVKLTPGELRELERIRRHVGRNPLRGSSLEHIRLPEFENRGQADFAGQLRADFASPTAEPSTDNLGDAESTYRRRSIRSLQRRLDAIAIDLEELGLTDQAEHTQELKSSLK